MSDTSLITNQQWQLFQARNASSHLKNKLDAIPQKTDADTLQQAQLKKVCSDFESLFVAQMMKDMRNAIPKEDLFHGGKAEEIYTSMLDEKYAIEISKNGSLGLGNHLYETLSKNLATSKKYSGNGD